METFGLLTDFAQERGGYSLRDVLGHLASVITSNRRDQIVPVVTNNEAVQRLPSEVAIEMSMMGRTESTWDLGAPSTIPRAAMGLVSQVAEYECVAVDAALSGEARDLTRRQHVIH